MRSVFFARRRHIYIVSTLFHADSRMRSQARRKRQGLSRFARCASYGLPTCIKIGPRCCTISTTRESNLSTLLRRPSTLGFEIKVDAAKDPAGPHCDDVARFSLVLVAVSGVVSLPSGPISLRSHQPQLSLPYPMNKVSDDSARSYDLKRNQSTRPLIGEIL